MVTLTKCRNCGSFFLFSHTQCDILFHFNLSVAFPFLCFVLHFICGWAGWYCFYLIAYNTKKNSMKKRWWFLPANIFFRYLLMLIFHFIWAFVDYFALLAYFFRLFMFRFHAFLLLYFSLMLSGIYELIQRHNYMAIRRRFATVYLSARLARARTFNFSWLIVVDICVPFFFAF